MTDRALNSAARTGTQPVVTSTARTGRRRSAAHDPAFASSQGNKVEADSQHQDQEERTTDSNDPVNIEDQRCQTLETNHATESHDQPHCGRRGKF